MSVIGVGTGDPWVPLRKALYGHPDGTFWEQLAVSVHS